MPGYGNQAKGTAGAQVQAIISERRKQVWALYLDCHTQTQIAEKLGVSQPTVSGDIAAVRAEVQCDRKALLEREAAALDGLQQSLAGQNAQAFSLEIIDRILAVMKRRAALHGLDAATRVKLELADATDEDLVAAYEEAVALSAARRGTGEATE